MDDRYKEVCPKCGKPGKVAIKYPQIIPSMDMVLQDLAPDGSVHITSKAQLKAECKLQGVYLDKMRKPKARKEYFV